VFVNPLAFLEADEPWASQLKRDITVEHILKFACVPGVSRKAPDIVSRYKRISVEEPRLFAAPAEARLLERLIWPLRNAKGSFMLGNYLGCISLCGMVAEMAAILVFDLSDFTVNGAPLDDARQVAMFGSRFERLGQERRVGVLWANRLIDDSLRNAFDKIRTIRRNYLHLWSASHASLEDDAVECFKSAVLIVVSALGLSVSNGKLVFRPKVLEYLRKHGVEPEPVEVISDG
jgi:hypothetical protein